VPSPTRRGPSHGHEFVDAAATRDAQRAAEIAALPDYVDSEEAAEENIQQSHQYTVEDSPNYEAGEDAGYRRTESSMPYGSPDFAFQVTSPDPRLCPISPNYEPNSTAWGQPRTSPDYEPVPRTSPDYEPAPRAPEHRSNSRESSILFTPPVRTPDGDQASANLSIPRYPSASFSPLMPAPNSDQASGQHSSERYLSASFSPHEPTPAGEAPDRVSQQPITKASFLDHSAPNTADRNNRSLGSSSPPSSTLPANPANPINVAQTQTDNRANSELLATEIFLAEDALRQWIRDNRGIRFFYSTERGPWPLPLGYFSSGGIKHYCSVQQLSERFPNWLAELRGSLADRVVG